MRKAYISSPARISSSALSARPVLSPPVIQIIVMNTATPMVNVRQNGLSSLFFFQALSSDEVGSVSFSFMFFTVRSSSLFRCVCEHGRVYG